ncbi:MAG TPA: glycoside hydrolase domain-containing protein [Acidobacteriaceae bacterium]|nr:glycoside hydrolase domain-containing protein [Acidobacteriaceae bacterium]
MRNRSHILRLVVSCLLLGGSAVAAQSTSPNQAPRWPQLPHPSPAQRALAKPLPPPVGYVRIGKFKLLNSSTGWAEAGDAGLLWTTDGGAHWKDISPPDPNGDSYADVFFRNQSDGWVLFSHQIESQDDPIPHNPDSDWTFYVVFTQDGGSAWTTVQIPAMRGRLGIQVDDSGQIAFSDSSNGWIEIHHRNGGSLLQTTDGGLHWEWVQSGPGLWASIRALSPRSLFVAGNDIRGNYLYATWDAGETFHQISLPRPSAIPPRAMPSYALPDFTDPQTGFETVTYSGAPGVNTTAVLYITGDGGHKWKPGSILSGISPDSSDTSSTIVDSTWIIPFKPYRKGFSLLKLPLADGMIAAPPNQAQDFDRCSLSFWGPSTGWASCGDPLSSTGDGGATWTIINPRAIEGTGKLTDAPVTPPPPAPPPPRASTIPNFEPVPRTQPTGASPESPDATSAPLPDGLSQQLAFDRSKVPTVNQMATWWAESPYYDVGIYLIGSPNKGPNTELTPDWVARVDNQGWGIIPIWFGLQDPCLIYRKGVSDYFSSTPDTAYAQGVLQALRAHAAATDLGLDGNVIYVDVENYSYTADSACSLAAQAYVSGFVSTIHVGFSGTVGVYGSVGDAIDIHSACNALGACNPPDYFWLGREDHRATVWNEGHGGYSNYLADSEWPSQERMHQYSDTHDETWGGVKLSIDNDVVDSPVVAGNPAEKPLNINSTPTPITYGSDPVIVTGIADGANQSSSTPPFIQGNLAAYDWFGGPPLKGTWASGQVTFQALPVPTSSSSSPCRISNVYYFVYTTGINGQGTVVGYITPPMDGPIQTDLSGTAVPDAAGSSYDCGTDGLIWPGPGEPGSPGPVIYKDPNAAQTELLSINDAGWITGFIIDKSGNYDCILVKPDAKGRYGNVTPIEFDEIGGDCENAAINGIGQIAGDSDAGAFYEDVEDGTPGENGVPVSGNPTIGGVNNNGFYVGPDYIQSLFTPTGYIFLPVLTYGLNDDPEVVGDDWSDTNPQGVLYDIVH